MCKRELIPPSLLLFFSLSSRSLIDTVYALRDQVKDLVDETKRLKKDLDDERRARKKLESTVRKSMKSIDIRFSDQTDL